MGIARVLEELREASATLPDYVRGAADAAGVALVDRVAVYDWWKTEAEMARTVFPALAFTWDGTTTRARRAPAGRRSVHRITASYAYRSANLDEIQRHILHVPDALLAWLDAFPTQSRAPGTGRTVVAVNVDEAEKEVAYELTHDVMPQKGGVFVWSADVALTVLAFDAAAILPRAPDPAPPAGLTLTPVPA
ncbi:hypothetical protein tb265_39050 [Gemmatimonadetes bacterium T265]|nr:hypothetical protein tb265_39050 [Gemmatimonadetes bacterium T265]